MAHGKDIGYSIARVFWALFILTAVEVAWGMFLREPRWVLWSGLIVCMIVKGLLIFMYFMHMRFERWILWSLIGPTPLLVMIVLFANMPDTSFNDKRDHPVGYLIDQSGEVVNALDPLHPAKGRGTPHRPVGEGHPGAQSQPEGAVAPADGH